MTKPANKPARTRSAKPAAEVVEVTSTQATAETTENATVIVTAAAEGKMSKAAVIFAECMAQSPVPARKDILARFQAEAGCTKAGSATYLQILKGRAGLVQHKAKAATA